MNAGTDHSAPLGASPKAPLEIAREIARLHLGIGDTLRELSELTQCLLLALLQDGDTGADRDVKNGTL